MRPLLLLVLLGCAHPAPDCDVEAPDGAVGTCAPPLRLPQSGGGRWSLDEARGTTVLLSLQAMWCGWCQREADELDALWADPVAGTTVRGVLFQDEAGHVPDHDDLRQWIDVLRLDHPVLLDVELEAWDLWGGTAQPLNVIVRDDGVVAWRSTGWRPADELTELLDAVATRRLDPTR